MRPFHRGQTVKCLPRWNWCVAVSLLVLAVYTTVGLSSRAAEDDSAGDGAAVYSASDFPRLAEGLDVGFTGEVTLSVWAPPRDRWRLADQNGTLRLTLESSAGDPEARWQVLGKTKLAKGEWVRVVVAGPGSKDQGSASSTGPAAPDSKTNNNAGTATQAKQALSVPALIMFSSASAPRPQAVLDLIRGRVETIEPTPDARRAHVRTNWQGAHFQAPASAAAWHDRALHLREQMLVALGLWPMFPKTPLNPRLSGKLDRDGYTIEKVVLETFPGFTLSGNVYRPIGTRGRVPAILCPHGHWEDGRTNPDVQQRCIRWAKLGCIVFMYDMVGYNDSKPFTHAFSNDRLRRWGLSLPTLQTWNSIRALDWLSTLPDVDPARIGCTGESGGGTQTFLLTALDDRIKVAAPVVMVSDTFQGGCACENTAGLRHGTDNVEFAALCAPRPLILVGASGDWTAKTMSRAYPAIRGVYSLVGATDRVAAQVFHFPHNYNQTTRNAVYAFMAHWLLGIDDSARTREGNQSVERPEDLLTFTPAHPALPDRKTPEQLEAFLIATRQRLVDDLAPAAASPARWQAARLLLATCLKTRLGVTNPPPDGLTHHEVRRITRDDFTIVHSVVGRRLSADAIPVVRLLPAHSSGRLTIVAHPRGKAALATAAGVPAPLVRALLSRGHSVVEFDPLFVGESIDPRSPTARRPEAAHFETYNPVVAADQMQDLATVVAWARSQPDVREVSLVGLGLAGTQVLLARPVLEGLARTAVELGKLPGDRAAGTYPAAVDLPGLFQFGGIKAAAALTAPAPLWIYGAPSEDEIGWAKTAYALSAADHTLRLEPREPHAERIAEWIDRDD
jgi:dienelactone hydrolase